MLTEDEVKMLKSWLTLMTVNAEKRAQWSMQRAFQDCLEYVEDIERYRGLGG